MNEQSKLNEAKYFYSRMLSEAGNRTNFGYNLSAFLSAARSVLQYALKEAQEKVGGKQWYDSQMSASQVLTFFKCKRNINIHTEPVQVNERTSIQFTEEVHISDTVHIRILDQNGNIIEESPSSQPPTKPPSATKVSNRFTFPDWSGPEDVQHLCEIYLRELQLVVTDGQNKGFLTKGDGTKTNGS